MTASGLVVLVAMPLLDEGPPNRDVDLGMDDRAHATCYAHG